MKMKIAIPTAQGNLCMHFGHCETFAVLTIDEQTKKITGRENLVPPPHEPGVLPAWLGEQKVNVIIAGGMGQRAQQLFTEQNIAVVVGATDGTPEELTAAYLAGTLVSGANACDH
jgi:predicted Fe-Mo cluster-binding NifX family protein